MTYPHLDLERKYWQNGLERVVGVDEAGRGPLAGPVVAAAVMILPELLLDIENKPEFKLIRDSKTLSEKQRQKAADFISNLFPWGVGWSDCGTIDRVNILQATFLAMKKALSDLKTKLRDEIDIVLVDGRQEIPNFSLKQEALINGDRNIFSIAAASIIAKTTRDRMMLGADEKFPEYGFKKHKGYGTKLHFDMLEKHGPSEIHRKSFRLSKKGLDKHFKETKIKDS